MEFQTLRLRADSSARVTWKVNDRVVPNEWPLRPGRHTITAVDTRGNRDSVSITVK